MSRVVNTFVLCATLLVGMAACKGQNKNTQAPANDSDNDTPSAMTGAYGEQRELTDSEMEMFRSAVAAYDSTVYYTPLSVSTQVVAGTNYRFWCRSENLSESDAAQDNPGHCWVIIFKPLPGRGEPVVTSVQKEL